MVDLHESLRPLPTVSPPPITEIAARAKRRKRRRVVSGSGLAVAAVGVIALVTLGLPDSPTQTTVAERPDEPPATDTTSQRTTEPPVTDQAQTPIAPATTDTTSASQAQTEGQADRNAPESNGTESDGAEDPATDSGETTTVQAATTPGIQTTSTITSEWENGFCMQVQVTNNNTVAKDDWQVVLDPDGTIATVWNAVATEVADGVFSFSGLRGYNDTVGPEAVTEFGMCVDTNSD